MKAFKFCLLPVFLFVVVFAIVSALGPAKWEAQAEVTIAATPDQIHPHVEDLRDWETWAAWHRKDPKLRSEYSGDPGVGMSSSWVDGDGMRGTNKILESDSSQGLTMETQMESFSPFRASIVYTPDGASTRVRWESSSELPFGMRGFFWVLKIDLGELVSEDYRDGLEGLKVLVEGEVLSASEE